tara:strand:- start:23388 stop:24140 length:753 start_codon:yes stop_codon:yes gene_type:complete
MNDKIIEKKRYEERFAKKLKEKSRSLWGSNSKKPIYRSPYIFFEKKISQLINHNDKVLEIGAGDGLHTVSLLETGANVVASDISPSALKLIKKNIPKEYKSSLKTVVADMEALPFEDSSFDVVTSAGSLSYGDSKKVLSEIHRILKCEGYFICIDSLNENPIYKLNRYIQYLRKKRSKITIDQMPSNATINLYKNFFNIIEESYFGSITWVGPLLAFFIGQKSAKKLLNSFDKKMKIKNSAFKFVLIVKK